MGLDVFDQGARKKIVANPNFSGTERCAFYCSNICSYLMASLFIIPILTCYGCVCCYLNHPMKTYVYSAYGRVRFVENKETHPGIRFRCCH